MNYVYLNVDSIPKTALCPLCNENLKSRGAKIVQLDCNHWFHDSCWMLGNAHNNHMCMFCKDPKTWMVRRFKVFVN